MADERIEDITGGELTAPAADDKLVILDADDTTEDAQGTAKYVELASLGHLEHEPVSADADQAMAVGKLYVVTMAAWASDNIFSLPSTAAVGDRVGIYIVDGDADYELQIRTTSLSGDTIDGQDIDDADFTKLFIQGEIMIFECITADSAWATVHDGRIPCYATVERQAVQTLSVSGTWYEIAFDNDTQDQGNIADSASDQILLRRDGAYLVAAGGKIKNVPAGDSAECLVKQSATAIADGSSWNAYSTVAWLATSTTPVLVAGSDGDDFTLEMRHFGGASNLDTSNVAGGYPKLVIQEVI